MNKPKLQLRGLTKLNGGLVAVRDLSLQIEPGAVFGFVGSNGAGKTTTMRIVLGTLLANRGEVLWGDSPIDFETRRRIGHMPEERDLKDRANDEVQKLSHGKQQKTQLAAVLVFREAMTEARVAATS